MEILFAWIIVSFIVSSIGSDRKIGYWGTFVISLFLSPIIGALFALASPRKKKNEYHNLPPSVYRYYNKARKEYKKNNIDMALYWLNKAFSIGPKSSMVLYSLAICYSAKKDKERGFYYLNKAVECGYSDFVNIQNNSNLIFLRKQKEFKLFVDNGYRLKNKDYTDTPFSKLEKLAELKEKGILTDAEFTTEKEKILHEG